MSKTLMTEGGVKALSPVGSYVGNGTSQDITLGFRPRKVKVYSEDNNFIIRKFGDGPCHGQGRMTSGGNLAHRGLKITNNGITFTDTGFSVGSNDAVNKNGVTYYYEVV